MDVKAYISSGILENYVLGLTTGEENLEVERYAKRYPEVQQEIQAIQEALNRYGESFQTTPPPALKGKIWAALQEADEQPATPVIPINRSLQNDSPKRWLVAASIILLCGSAALNAYLYIQWRSVKSELAALTSEKEYLASQFQVQQTSYNKLQKDLAFVSMPATKAIKLGGVPRYPDAMAVVYFNASTQEVYLKVNNLPLPPTGKQYQLWAIVDGSPVDAGVFATAHDTDSLYQMKNFTAAQAFAITLEEMGGSAVPNLEALYVIGNV